MGADLAQLGATIATVLAPFTPYLVAGGKAFASKAGGAAWAQAAAMWKALRSHFGEQTIETTAIALSRDPKSQKAIEAFARVLTEQLKNSPGAASELMALLGGPGASQTVVGTDESVIEDVRQRMTGKGRQNVTASGRSQVSKIKQDIK